MPIFPLPSYFAVCPDCHDVPRRAEVDDMTCGNYTNQADLTERCQATVLRLTCPEVLEYLRGAVADILWDRGIGGRDDA